MADRTRTAGAARRSSGGGRRRAPAKSGPSPVLLIGIVAVVIAGVVFALMSGGGSDGDGGGDGGGVDQASSGGAAAGGTGSSTGNDSKESSIFDADAVDTEKTGGASRPRVTGREPKTLVMKKLTEHLGHLYLSDEASERIRALESETEKFLEERWDVSREMKAEYRTLVETVSRERNDPFLRAVDDELGLYNTGPAFAKTNLHLKDASGKLLPAPFKGFAKKPYAIFVQASPDGGEKEMADKVGRELSALAKAFTDYFGDIIDENERTERAAKERAGKRYRTREQRYPVMKVMLFQTRKDYDEYNRMKDPERDVNFALAHYEPDKHRLHVPMSGFPEHMRREVMFHEGTHQLLHYYTDKNHLGNWGAMWSDEGVAEFFGGHTAKEDGSFEFGKMVSRVESVARDAKNRKKRLSMVDLLSWTRSDYQREKDEDFRKATEIHLHVYSQGWALVKFLDARYKKQWHEIMRRQIVEGDAGLPVFRQVFQDDFERVEEEFQTYQDELTDLFRTKKLENGEFH